MRGMLLVLLCCACGMSIGCAMTDDNTLKPGGQGHRDEANDPQAYHDEWDIRKEARGSEATEKEWDGWTKYMMSPKAMAIERNMGYGY